MIAGILVSASLFVSSGWMCPARFAPLPQGWVQGSLGPSDLSYGHTDSWAHTRGFHNLNDISPSGVYVEVLLSRRDPTSPALTARRRLRLPLRTAHPDQIATQEGSSLPEYRFAGLYRRLYYVDVRVDFGRRLATAAMTRRSQVLLRTLRLPGRFARSALNC